MLKSAFRDAEGGFFIFGPHSGFYAFFIFQDGDLQRQEERNSFRKRIGHSLAGRVLREFLCLSRPVLGIGKGRDIHIAWPRST